MLGFWRQLKIFKILNSDYKIYYLFLFEKKNWRYLQFSIRVKIRTINSVFDLNLENSKKLVHPLYFRKARMRWYILLGLGLKNNNSFICLQIHNKFSISQLNFRSPSHVFIPIIYRIFLITKYELKNKN